MARSHIPKRKSFHGRRTAARLLLSVFSLAFAAAVAEVAVRNLMPKRACLRFEQNVNELQQMGLNDLVVESDPELFWRLAPNQRRPSQGFPFRGVVANSEGLRMEQEIPRERTKAEIRILFLGDSCTFGHGLLPNETFVAQVALLLRAQYPDIQFQCINAGVPGYSLFQGLRFLEIHGPRYRSDLVVASFGFNDGSTWDNRSDMDHYRQSVAARPVSGLRWSRLCELVWQLTSQSGQTNATRRPRLTGTEFLSLLSRLHQVCSQQDCDLLLLALPSMLNLDPRYRREERTDLQGAVIAYGQNMLRLDLQSDGVVDMIPILQDLAEKVPRSQLMFDHVHPTAMVNEHYARAIVAKLQPWVASRVRALRSQP